MLGTVSSARSTRRKSQRRSAALRSGDEREVRDVEKLFEVTQRPGVVEVNGQYFNTDGYPVDFAGRPDWCSVCVKSETEHRLHDDRWRPNRVETVTLSDHAGRFKSKTGLCRHHNEV